ncbi:MAG: hypothetical protein P8189_24435 [Anaerolineae bacterium]
MLFGVGSPVEASEAITDLLSGGWEALTGGKLEFVPDPDEMVRRSLAHIDAKRGDLGLPAYDPARFGQSGDARFDAFLARPVEARNPYSWVR